MMWGLTCMPGMHVAQVAVCTHQVTPLHLSLIIVHMLLWALY
jgi:hypothetical protein